MATTISSYSVSLALDAKDYIRNSGLSRAETGRLVREINGARTPADNYARSLSLVDKALKAGAIDQGVYNRLLDAASSKLGHVATQTTLLSRAMVTFGIETKSAAGGVDLLALATRRFAAAYVAYKVVQGAKAAIGLSSEAEDASASFSVLIGDMQSAKALIVDLRELAAKSPLSVGDTQKAAQTLMLFGVAASQVLPTLKMLGDVTGGNSERFKFMTLAFSQMTSAGRLLGGELRQMVEAGFNPLQEISRKTGETMLELKKRMEDGGVSSQEVTDAFKSVTSEGGRMFGMIEERSKTMSGQWAMMTAGVKEFATEIGDGLTPALKGLMGIMTSIMDLQKEWEVGKNFQVGMGAIGAVGKDMWDWLTVGDNRDRLPEFKNLGFFREEKFNPPLMSKPDPKHVPDWFDPKAAGKANDAANLADRGDWGLGDALASGIESLRSGAGGLMDIVSATREAGLGIAMAGIANTQELIQATKEDPAIKSLEVGTQEAYAYLTQASRDAEKQAMDAAAKQAQLEENAKKQRDQMVIWLDRINTSLENNGFRRIR